MLHKIYSMIHHALLNKYRQFMSQATLPLSIRNMDWDNTTVLRVGGAIRLLDGRIAHAKIVEDVNISDDYHDRKNFIPLGKDNTEHIKADAHSLPMLHDESVDFVASSGTVEHLTNPLKALLEWKRILKTDGLMYMSVPYYKKTFDHRRSVTPFAHLIDDYKNNTGLDDTTHTEEFLKNFDATAELVYHDYDAWYANYITNPQIYTHFHVFDKNLVREMMAHLGFKTEKIFYAEATIEYYGRKI